MIQIIKKEVLKTDLGHLTRFITQQQIKYFLGLDCLYHLLAYLSTKWNDSILVDIGTCLGTSAVALSFNKSNTVYSYDIGTDERNKHDFPHNIIFKLEDPIENREELLLKSKFIFLDVNPHDGIQEKVLFDFLIENNYRGVLGMDDIHHVGGREWQYPGLIKFWEDLTKSSLVSYDLTDVASEHGFGIIDFSNELEVK